MNIFTKNELKLIVKHCCDIEEEYGISKDNKERLANYLIAVKANLLLGDDAQYLGVLESNLEDSGLIEIGE
ncbi:hypothetical protein SAMN04487895_101519 [Paenibacillus sophorae]|uniref:Uncharacterized protein n=1 Tax=Paenibacillus sophorae TaxID=1333845 RepID=A0A1H8GH46_9BACL|nr:hypothetical protein [Paenibacillus sophorae]QWU14229.1 hypothetical protein KP014_20170 [Paenibacillus sophorae]SEN43501.1 hypothetical protein SAMN04487895_101519 [Paenibacillus sophorae]